MEDDFFGDGGGAAPPPPAPDAALDMDTAPMVMQMAPEGTTADITPSAEAGYGAYGGDFGGDDGMMQHMQQGDMGYMQDGSAGGYGSLDGVDDGSGMGMGMPQVEDVGMSNGAGGMHAFHGMPEPEEVSDNALTRFMGEWKLKLSEKAAAEEMARQQALTAARADQDKVVAERALRKETRMSNNRAQEQVFLEQLESELESDNPWERIVSLVDTQAEASAPFQDTSRIKSIIIQLKNDPIPVRSAA